MSTTPSHAGMREPDLRVILVGRTGLDARLRLEQDVELVRVKTALDAVGEVAEGEGGAQVVIVAPEGEPKAEGGRGPEFLRALRLVSPKVRVLRLGESAPGYDGVISAAGSVESLRSAIRGGGEPAGIPADEPAAAPAPRIEQDVDAPPAAAGDVQLVRLLLQGKELTGAAVDLVRQRLARDVEFIVPGGTGAADPAHEAPVSWRGRDFGRLRSEHAAPQDLAAQASWLASWLALADQHAQLRHAAFADPLTGAHNRRYFDHFLSVAIEQAKANRRTLTVLVFDIDDFKTYNDRYGHPAGDEILCQAVRLLESVIRPSDKVCRIGGDEFAVIFHEPQGPREPGSKPPASVFEIARRFQKEICAHRFPKLGADAPGTLTISGGLATYPWDGATAADLLRRADDLALRSKREGKNAITFGPGAERVCGLIDPGQTD